MAVTAVASRRGDIITRVLASGSVISIRDAKIGSKISGRVATVFVDEGTRVAAGTPLLQLDTSDLVAQQAQARATAAAAEAQLQKVLAGARPQERVQSTDAVNQAKAALTSAQASLALAKANLARMESLETEGAVSRQDLDTTRTQAQVAQAQVGQAQAAYDSAVQNASMVHIGSRDEDIQAARAQLAQAEAGLAAVQVQLRDSTIVAPFAGTITQRSVEPGETVSSMSSSAASPLFVLSQIDDIYVELTVPQQHHADLRAGQQAVMTVDGLAGRTFWGRVELIRPAADSASRTFGVKVRVPNPQGILRPGMFARGGIIVAARRQVLQVPEESIMTAVSGPNVFVVRDGRAVRRPVVLGVHQQGLVEVTSGLNAGERVVIQGQDSLTDNQPVTLRAP
jgi:RND family efflux transporter MFP subunit